MLKVDIAYKTYSKDAKWLWNSLRSVVKNVVGYGNIYLLTDDELGATPSDLQDLNIIRIVTPIHQAATLQRGNPSVGYFNQILIKLQLFSYLPANVDRVLLLDSDMLVTKRWDITAEPNRWFYRDWSEAGDGIKWKACVDTLFDNKPPYSQMAMGFPAWFLTRGFMNTLLTYLSERLGHQHIDNDFWNHLGRICHYTLSEFEVMGNYLWLQNQLDYGLQKIDRYDYPIWQFWSHETDPKKLKAIDMEIQRILNA